MPTEITNKRAGIYSASALLVVTTLIGCHLTETLWTEQVPSPDGNCLVLARTDNTDTIGNVEYTIVYLKQVGFWHQPKELVVFDGIDHQEDFQMRWDSPSHIDMVVHGYGPATPYRTVDPSSPVTFSVHYIQKPYQPIQ
jgi:hypothetical protein